MANKINHVGNVICISEIDSDWSWSDNFDTNQIRIQSIQFNGGAADDVLVLRNGGNTDDYPELIPAKVQDGDYDQRYKLFDGVGLSPVLCFDEGTYSAGSKVTIIINPHRG